MEFWFLFWLELFCSNEYVLADNCTMTLQTPSGNLEGEPDYKGTTSLEYKYYFNLGAPTELPALTSYAGTLSEYHAGVQVENTQLEIMVNGKKIPEVMKYGMSYALLDEKHQFIEQIGASSKMLLMFLLLTKSLGHVCFFVIS